MNTTNLLIVEFLTAINTVSIFLFIVLDVKITEKPTYTFSERYVYYIVFEFDIHPKVSQFIYTTYFHIGQRVYIKPY